MFVVAVLCALSCLAVLVALASDRAARDWGRQLHASATIQVRPKGGETSGEASARAAEALAGTPGVVEARALDRAAAAALLEPWLGKDGVPDDLPIPELVTVDLDPAHPADAAALDAALVKAGVDASVDDHGRWLKDVDRSAGSLRLAAFGLAALMAAAAGASIAFATRAGLSARHELVELLHLTGAEDRFIARLFMRRFARFGADAGVIGAAGALTVWIALKLSSAGAGFTPLLPLAWSDLWAIAPVPVLAAGIGAISASRTAMVIVRSRTGWSGAER
jgi:cell division transport system permease protein